MAGGGRVLGRLAVRDDDQLRYGNATRTLVERRGRDRTLMCNSRNQSRPSCSLSMDDLDLYKEQTERIEYSQETTNPQRARKTSSRMVVRQ